MRKQMSELLNSKDFDDGQTIRSEKALRRWRSACHGRRSFHKLTDFDKHPKLQEQVRALSVVLKAVIHFTENLSGRSNEDVPSSEYIVTEAGTEARRFHEPIDDIGSTVGGLDEQLRVSSVVLKAVLHFTENLSLHSNEDVPSSEYSAADIEAGRFQEPVDDVGSSINGHDVCKLFGKCEKHALAVFYLVLESASFLLDIFGKSKRSILLAAFLLSAFGFAITMSMHICILRRSRAATRIHCQKLLLMVLEISFSMVQLIVTLIYFILAELGVKHNFNASVFPLVFAIIAAVFTFKYDREVSDSSGLASSLMASAADLQLQNFQVHITDNEDEEANGSMPMLTILTSND